MRRALIIGIDNYPSAPLAGCVNDALAIRKLLSNHEDGSPNFECRLITAPSDEATRPEIYSQIEELFAHEADLAFFYFSGHGTENNLGGYLVTTDSSRYEEGIPMRDILLMANKSRVREIVIMLDCCHSGAFGNVPEIDNESALLREGVSILTASRSNQSAVESGRAGVFTSLVCGALDGGAADILGNVTVVSLYSYVDQALGPWSQRPLLKSHVSRLTTLRKCSPAIPIETIRRLPEWFPAPDHEFALDPSYEPDAEPHDEEHESIFRELQACRSVKLVEPVGAEHMYYAAMNNCSCRLTRLGQYYWRLANEGRI